MLTLFEIPRENCRRATIALLVFAVPVQARQGNLGSEWSEGQRTMECVAQNRIVPRTGTMSAGGVDNAERRRLNQLGQLISSLQHIPHAAYAPTGPTGTPQAGGRQIPYVLFHYP